MQGDQKAADKIHADVGELLPGMEFCKGGDTFSLSFPSVVKPKKPKQ